MVLSRGTSSFLSGVNGTRSCLDPYRVSDLPINYTSLTLILREDPGTLLSPDAGAVELFPFANFLRVSEEVRTFQLITGPFTRPVPKSSRRRGVLGLSFRRKGVVSPVTSGHHPCVPLPYSYL